MTGVHSLWTRPDREQICREALLLQTLSLCYMRLHFVWTELVTDVRGLLIADRLRWRYDSFRTDLERIEPRLSHVWSAGKFVAQLIQKKPYAHLDNDFLLFDPLPVDFRRSRIFIQGKDEPSFYLNGWMDTLMKRAGIDVHACAYNAGIIGGCDVPLLHDYCRFGLDTMRRIADDSNGTAISIIGEQAAFGQFLRDRRVRPAELIPIPLSESPDDYAKCKFTHVWAWTKRDRRWAEKVEHRLAVEFPEEYADFVRGFPKLDQCLNHRRRIFGSGGSCG